MQNPMVFCGKDRVVFKMDLLFFGKKIISRLFLTLTAVWLALLVAFLFPCCAWWLLLGVLVILAFGGTVGQMILSRLSRAYPQFTADGLSEPRYLIAVAGSGFQQHSRRVPESWFGDNFVIRLTEAGRVAGILQQAHVDFLLCLSMPEYPELYTQKLLGLQAFFSKFGISPEQIRIVDTALDSEDEVAAFKQYHIPVILVSNSWHIPRLMRIAECLRCRSLPAPAGQLFHMPHMKGFSCFLPTAGNLQTLECGLHELAGMIQTFCKYRVLHWKL